MMMRVDKFLKTSRLIKRRTLAKEIADQGRISINGQQAKAGSPVKASDEVAIRFGQKLVTVKIERILQTTKKDEAANMYTVVSEEMLEDIL